MGFVYDHIGLGGILIIDFLTYVVSLACYYAVRRGRHTVKPAEPADVPTTEGAVGRYFAELREGLAYLRGRPFLMMLGLSWGLFLGAMLTQGVITAPLSDRILHTGAVGYGWMNGAWGLGAFLSALYAPKLIRALRSRPTIVLCMASLAAGLAVLPYLGTLFLVVPGYLMLGSARGVGGIALSSKLMEIVPKHFMGRVQNTYYLTGTLLQIVFSLIVGVVAHRVSLSAGFAIVGAVYLVSCLAALLPVEQQSVAVPPEAAVEQGAE